MRIVDWNIAHMNSWFVPGDDPDLRASFPGSNFGGGRIDDVPGLARRAADVLNALGPDLITVQEGAGQHEVASWAQQFLEGDWAILGGSGGAQKLLFMHRTDNGIVTGVAPADDSAFPIRLDEEWQADVDADFFLEDDNTFARVPLAVDFDAHGRRWRILNCHSKSKFVQNGETLWEAGGSDRQQFIRQALKNRRRISAEGFRIRSYLDQLLDADSDRSIIVAGDLNDGIGFDFFERLYLTHSVVDLVFGSVFYPEKQLRHVLLEAGQPAPHTAEFFDFVEGRVRDLLLDHIGLSPAAAPWLAEGRVADAEYDAQSDQTLPNPREREPSDHRPVLADLQPPG